MAEVHYRAYKVREFLEGWSPLKEIELKALGDLSGKSLLHLMCQFGMDTLSWARLGVEVTGADISDKSIELANKLKKESGLSAEFIRSDVLELPKVLDRKFDIVFQSYGTHAWIGDLKRWGEVVAHFLKPGGIFYMVDFHPLGTVIEEEEISYFNPGPYRYRDEPDYADKDYIVKSETVEWQHTISDILNAIIGAGLRIESFDEFDKCCYAKTKHWVERDGWYYPPGDPPSYPLMFSLRAVRD
jgi:ubiquinone/menaquinone biosynthesis C-methylase UbiE